MKIIYLHQYFTSPEMSGGTRSYEMARRMVAAGHEVHMVTSYRDADSVHDDWFETTEAGIKVHWYPVPYSNDMGFYQRIRAFFAFALAARKKTASIEGDVIFATSTPLTIALPAVPAARRKKIPMVFEVRDLWPEMPIAVGALKNPILKLAAKRLEHWAYQNSSAVVALSPGMQAGVIKTGYPKDNVAVIPNSSDNVEFKHNYDAAVQFRADREWLGDKPLLVYTGTLGPTNGVGYLVPVAQELMRMGSDIRILVVGDGAEKAQIMQHATSAGVLNQNFYIEKAIPKRDMPGLLSAADMASALFIDLPEMRSNSANKFFDALASGTPVLLNYGGWMHEMVKAKGCGLPLWSKSPKEVALELESRMHDEEWLKNAGTAARELAEECFDRDKLAKQLVEVLQAAVDGRPELSAKIAPGDYSYNAK